MSITYFTGGRWRLFRSILVSETSISISKAFISMPRKPISIPSTLTLSPKNPISIRDSFISISKAPYFESFLIPMKKPHFIKSVPGNSLLISKNDDFIGKALDFAPLI